MTSTGTVPQDPTTSAGQRTGADPKWWTLAAVCLGTFMLLLDVTIVNVALPDIQTSLQCHVLRPAVGDRRLRAHPRRAAADVGLAGRPVRPAAALPRSASSSSPPPRCCAAAAQSSLMLELSRGLQGVGGAIMFSVSLALLADAFRGKDRGIAFGIWGAITGRRGGDRPDASAARWSAACPGGGSSSSTCRSALIALALTVAAGARVPQRARPAARLGRLRRLLRGAGLPGLRAHRVRPQRLQLGATVIGCLVAAAVLLLAFVVVEARSDHPMFDLSLFRLPTFVGGDIAAFGVSAGDLLGAALPRALPAGRARLHRAADRPAAAHPLRRDPRGQRRGRAAELEGARCGR